jgi:phenylalanyl-tRNA synthetase beta subunit
MPKHTPTGEVAATLGAIHPWIQNITVSSIYEDSARLGPENKSVNFSFLLSNIDATISDNEAGEVQNLIIETMKHHGYNLRTI